MDGQRLRDALGAAVRDAPSALDAAQRLCAACVELLDVDGASISFVDRVEIQGTYGASGKLSRTLGDLQFTYGQGPCLDAVQTRRPVLAPDLADTAEDRWPALTRALLDRGIGAVFALPVTVTSVPVGALELYRCSGGRLEHDAMTAVLWAAGLAAGPMLDLMTADTHWPPATSGPDSAQGSDSSSWQGGWQGGWQRLAALEHVEVYQATGMIVEARRIPAADALLRLRAHAISHDLTASEVAHRILNRRLLLDHDDWYDLDDEKGSP